MKGLFDEPAYVVHTPCVVCGEKLAPFGSGKPTVWKCHGCWLLEPHTQQMISERINREDEDAE